MSVLQAIQDRFGVSEFDARRYAYMILLRNSGSPGFTPARLFAAGEQGYWLDPSDFSTMFQDSAGTTPVTAVGQNVGRILDKSGRGNHFIQSSLASRPVLGRNPITGTRNLLVNTGFDGAASGTPGTAPTNWPFTNSGGTFTYIANDAGLGGGSIRFAVSANRHFVGQFVTTLAATGTWTFSCEVQVVSGTVPVGQLLRLATPPAGALSQYVLNGVNVLETENVPIGSNTISIILTTTGTGGSVTLRLGLGASANVTGDAIFRNPQFEVGSVRTNYQRVGSAFDVTEAGVPDAYYLSYDGSDDFLVSAATIDPGAVDAISMFAGVRKISDTARGTVIEHTASVAANNGGFQLTAPNAAAGATYAFESKGTALTDAIASGFTAPITNVVTGLADISADSNIIRVNGVQADSDTGDQGTGNFANALHYIGRRGGTSQPANMRLYQAIARFAATDAGTIQQAEAFVNGKTGAY
jgi:hypothetical protein